MLLGGAGFCPAWCLLIASQVEGVGGPPPPQVKAGGRVVWADMQEKNGCYLGGEITLVLVSQAARRSFASR